MTQTQTPPHLIRIRVGAGAYESTAGHQVNRIGRLWFITFPGEITPDVSRPTLRESWEYIERETHNCDPQRMNEVRLSGCAKGCKVMACDVCGREMVIHSTTYGCQMDSAHAEAIG